MPFNPETAKIVNARFNPVGAKLYEEPEQFVDNTLEEDIQAGATKVFDGLFLGFGDEFMAGMQTTRDEVLEFFGAEAKDASERYSSYLEEGREIEKRFSRDNPILSAGLEIGGALATTFATGGIAGVGMAATRAGNVGRLGLQSAVEVSAYQFGEGEGGFENRIGNIDPATVALSAGIGGIAGATLRGVAEPPVKTTIRDKSTSNVDKGSSPSRNAVQRGELKVGAAPVDKSSGLGAKFKQTMEALGLRTKNWTAENVSEEASRKAVDADGQAMRDITVMVQRLDESSGSRNSMGRLHEWFEGSTEGQQAMKFLADVGQVGKYGVVQTPGKRRKNYNKAMEILEESAPPDLVKTFREMEKELRKAVDLDPGNKATDLFMPFYTKTGKVANGTTGAYQSPVANMLAYIEDVTVANRLAKNYGIDTRKMKPLNSVEDLRKLSVKLKREGLKDAEIEKQIANKLRDRYSSNTEAVIAKIRSDYGKKAKLNAAQKANLEEILTATFISGRRASNPTLDAIRVAVSTSQLARVSNAVLNVSELGIAATNFGMINALKALPFSIRSMLLSNGDRIIDDFGNGIRAADLGIVNQFMGEIRVADRKGKNKMEKFSDFLFSAAGVRKINRLGQEVQINAALKQAQAFARKGRLAEFKSAKGMDKTELAQLQKALVDNDIQNPLVKDMVFRALTDVAPVSATSMPKAYNQHPDGRVFYSMLSFMVQQQNLLREEVGRKLVKAYKHGLNTKEGRKNFKEAGEFGMRYVILTAGVSGFFDDGRKIARGEDMEYNPVESTANQMAQLATYGMVQPRAAQYGRPVVDPLNPPQLSLVRDVGKVGAKAATGELEVNDVAKLTQRWLPGASTLDDFFRYFSGGDRLLSDD